MGMWETRVLAGSEEGQGEKKGHIQVVWYLVKVDPATSVLFGHSPVAFSALGGELRKLA